MASVSVAGSAIAFVREVLEAVLDEQHDEGLVADDHAGRLLVGEPRIEREAELLEEVHRPV